MVGMATKSSLSKLFEFILPKKKATSGGTSYTNTYDPSRTTIVLDLPGYMEHLDDIQSTRLSETSLDLIKDLLKTDPDVSAALNAYLTVADTQLLYTVRDSSGEISREGQKLLESLLYKIFEITDYSLGYQYKPSLNQTMSELRYMALMRGAVGVELVYDKSLQPSSLRLVDMATIEFMETSPGIFKPYQTTDSVEELSLDIPTFFTARFKQDPTDIYSYSYFTSAINTIAARQTVINDLYRIMRFVGYPRVTLEVVEEVIKNRAPKKIRDNPEELANYISTQLTSLANNFDGIRPDKVFVHTDAIKPSILNDKSPGASLSVSQIIETLNAQNQAGLKVVATVLGRGESGVNTASVESRIFSLGADSLNTFIADLLSRVMTLALRTSGFDGFVKFRFKSAEMRPDLELESQRIQKQTRLQKDLSLGIITDEYYSMEMYGTVPNDSAPILSGTRFLDSGDNSETETSTPSTLRDNSIGRQVTPDDAESAESNVVKQV